MGTTQIEIAGPEIVAAREPLCRELFQALAATDPNPVISPHDADVLWQGRRELYRAWLAQPGSFAVLARDEGALVGYAVIEAAESTEGWDLGGPSAEMQSLFVRERHRRHGVARALIQRARGTREGRSARDDGRCARWQRGRGTVLPTHRDASMGCGVR